MKSLDKYNIYFQIFTCVLLVGFLNGCSDNVEIPTLDSLVGTWELEKIEPSKKEVSESLLNARITFTVNGEMTAYTVHKDKNGTIIERDTMTYRTDFNKLFLDATDDSDYGSFQFEDNRLIIYDPVEDVTAYFVRKED